MLLLSKAHVLWLYNAMLGGCGVSADRQGVSVCRRIVHLAQFAFSDRMLPTKVEGKVSSFLRVPSGSISS